MQVADGDILAISPHLDDAVLGMGAVLAAASFPVVVTIFAGDPGGDTPASAWDRGLARTASEVIAVRRHEDECALRSLGAHAVHCGFLEAPYRSRLRCHETDGTLEIFSLLRREIVGLIAVYRPVTLVVPLGLGHVDHQLASAAAISAWITDRTCGLWVYAEQPYADYDRARTHRRIHELRASAVPARQTAAVAHAIAAKQQAVMAYRSQLEPLQRAFHGWDAMKAVTELLWELHFDPDLGRLPVAVAETSGQTSMAVVH